MLLVKQFIVVISMTIATSFSTSAQNWVIAETGSEYSQEQLTDAVKSANLSGYRLFDRRLVMNFSDGSRIILYSSEELKSGTIVPLGDYPQDEHSSIFRIHPSGIIMEQVDHANTKGPKIEKK